MDSAQRKIKENYLKREPHITLSPVSGMFFEEDEKIENSLNSLREKFKMEKVLTVNGFYRDYKGKIIGKNTVDKIELPVGEKGQTLCFTIPEITLSPFGPKLKKICLKKEKEGKEILVPLKQLQSLMGKENKISSYYIYLENPEKIKVFSAEIKNFLPQNLKMETVFERNLPVFYALKMEKISMILGVFLILFVSIFQLYFSLKLLFFHYKSIWAIFKVFGMDSRDIKKIFKLFCIYIFSISSILGFLLSIILIKSQNHYNIFPFPREMEHFRFIKYQIPFSEFLFLFIFLIAISLLIGEIIGRQANRLNAQEILRVPQ